MGINILTVDDGSVMRSMIAKTVQLSLTSQAWECASE